jgi:endogenous inhibitor of DNA gyrase (YacG/DUF329 family)
MAMLQLKCPKSGQPIDIQEAAPPRHSVYTADLWGTEVPCPHCGETHLWTKSEWVRALETLRHSPDAARVLVDGDSVTALS